MMAKHTANIDNREYIYGIDTSIRLDHSGLFYVKGSGNKVILNKLPAGVKSITILDGSLNTVCGLKRVFTFKAGLNNMLLIEMENGDYREFLYDSNIGFYER